MGRTTDWFLALAGGLLLALMIDTNSLLAKHSTPVLASWLAHGIGAFGALVLVVLGTSFMGASNKKEGNTRVKGPRWAYLGGIPGALIVMLAAVTVNSHLGLSGTIALMLVGQVLFGMLSDHLGLFGVPKRQLIFMDFWVVFLVLTGSGILIFVRG